MRRGVDRGARKRTAWFVVDDLAEAVAIAAQHGDVLVVDIENTLVDYESTVRDRHDAIATAIEVVAAHDVLRRLMFVSNARFDLPSPPHESLAIRTVTAARKPHVRIPPLRQFRSEMAGAAVYGDQPLTDGMLARHLGGIWLQPRHAHEVSAPEPWWPRVMRQAGRQVVDRRFRPANPGPGPGPER